MFTVLKTDVRRVLRRVPSGRARMITLGVLLVALLTLVHSSYFMYAVAFYVGSVFHRARVAKAVRQSSDKEK